MRNARHHCQVWPHLLKLAAVIFQRFLFSPLTRPFFRFLSILVQNENVARHILREHCKTPSDLAAISSLMVIQVAMLPNPTNEQPDCFSCNRSQTLDLAAISSLMVIQVARLVGTTPSDLAAIS
jgi:hypothetical protein